LRAIADDPKQPQNLREAANAVISAMGSKRIIEEQPAPSAPEIVLPEEMPKSGQEIPPSAGPFPSIVNTDGLLKEAIWLI